MNHYYNQPPFEPEEMHGDNERIFPGFGPPGRPPMFPGGGPPFFGPGGPPQTDGPPFFGPGGGPQTGGPPSTPPPAFQPEQPQVQLFAIDPGAIQRCLFRFTFIWLDNGRSFWYFPTFVGRRSVAGFRWSGFRWVYFGIDLDRISSFQCF